MTCSAMILVGVVRVNVRHIEGRGATHEPAPFVPGSGVGNTPLPSPTAIWVIQPAHPMPWHLPVLPPHIVTRAKYLVATCDLHGVN